MFACCMRETTVENVVDLRIRDPKETMCKPIEKILVADEVIYKPIENILIPVEKEIIFDEPEIIICVEKTNEETIKKFNIRDLPNLPDSPKTPESVD